MIEIDRIANLIHNGLRPSNGLDIDEVEEKKLKEANDYWNKVFVWINCLHHNTITHTNGDIECLRCHKMLKIKEKGGE